MAQILICDDEEPIRALVAATLDGLGHSLLEARDGERALELARQHRPQLVILDVMMPKQSGLDVLTAIKREAQLGDTKVIVLTARAQRVDSASALAAGADVFMAKPFRPAELVAAVERLLAA